MTAGPLPAAPADPRLPAGFTAVLSSRTHVCDDGRTLVGGTAGGVVHLRPAARPLLVEYARSACRWAEGVIFINGHGGHVATIARAVEQLRDEGRGVAWTACAVPGGDAHAGRTETSVMRYIAPWAVQVELAAAGATESVVDLLPRLRLEGVRAVSPNGVLGDATTSTVAEGREVFAAIVARVARELFTIDVDPHGRLREAVPQP